MKTFTRTVREAVKFFLRNGYTSRQELEQWQALSGRQPKAKPMTTT